MGSTKTKTFVSIQYLRALAATLVVVDHANTGPIHVSIIGSDFVAFGVDLFFVISGYIMWATTSDTLRTPQQFWSARISRIVPLYWASTSFYVVLVFLHPSFLVSPSTDLGFIAKSYVFVPAFHPVSKTISPIYSLGWTLNYEMFFYFVFGIALLVQHRAARLASVTLVLGSLVLTGFIWRPADAIIQTYTNELLLEFMAGIFIAAASEYLMRWGGRVAWPILGLVVVWLFGSFGHNIYVNDTIVLFGFPAALTVLGFVSLEPRLRNRPQILLLLVGDASYSLYLCHPFVLRALYLLLPTGAAVSNPRIGLFCIAIASAVTIPVAIAIYKFAERPVSTRLRRLINRQTEDSVSLPQLTR